MSLPTNVLAAAVDLSGLPCYNEGERAQLLQEAYRLHFIYNAVHKTANASDNNNIRALAALPLFFEHYDATGTVLNLLGQPFSAADPCVADAARLAAAIAAFFAATQPFWSHPAVMARKAQLVAREAYLDECPRIAAGVAAGASDGIIDDADITTITVADMEAIQEVLALISDVAKEARSVARRVRRFAEPDAETLTGALQDIGDNVKEIQDAVRRVEGIFVEGGFR